MDYSFKRQKRNFDYKCFLNILDESNSKSNKILTDKGSEFYNRSKKSWLQDNDIEMHSTNNKIKSVVAERFLRKKFANM